jgi:hypothetical protein
MRGKNQRKKKKQQTPHQPQPPIPPRVNQEVPAAPKSSAERSDKKDKPVSFVKLIKEDPKFRLEILAAMIGAAVLGVYAFQLSAMRDAITQTQRNFEKDQAPVIWTSPQNPTVEIGKRLEWNIFYSNYGRSPALDLRHCALLAQGPLGLNALQSLPPPSWTNCASQQVSSTGVLPQGYGPNYTSALSPAPLTDNEVAVIKSVDGGAISYGVISYNDAAGHTYESTFCYYRLITGAMMNCEKYNTIRQTK